jgi:hypothetical protein
MKIVIQFVLSVLGSVIFGMLGLFLGFSLPLVPSLGGLQGYESSVVFFSTLGISLGSFLFTKILKNRKNEEFGIVTAIIVSLVVFFLSIIILDYTGPITYYNKKIIELVVLFAPSVILTIVTNWSWFLKIDLKKQLLFILIPFLILIFCVYILNQENQKISELNYKPTEMFCSSFSTNFPNECSLNYDKCIECKETPTSTYFTCHSRKFCEDKFKGKSLK